VSLHNKQVTSWLEGCPARGRAMATSSASESDPLPPKDQKKRHKEEKKEKKKGKERDKDIKDKKLKKAKKEKKAKSESSSDRGARNGCDASSDRDARQRKEVGPNFAPSGLLAQAGSNADRQPPTRGLGPARPARSRTPPTRGLGPARPPREARSRSRDDPLPPTSGANLLDRTDDAGSDGKGMGKDGKGKDGKGKGKGKEGENGEAPEPKEEPNFEPSGLLAVEDNSKNGIPLKFTMPSDSRQPSFKWRLYVFSKQNEEGKVLHIHRQPGYLFGKDRRVVDVPTDHPTCSKQHAVLHYRVHAGTGGVRPYLMDLETVNGTFINGERIQAARYYEVKEQDRLKFGLSSREYVLLHTGCVD